MNAAPDPNWKPDVQLLAAYFDGELECQDETRARVEAWLEAHPEAIAECTAMRSLQKVWLDTTPAEPSSAAWQHCRAGIDAGRVRVLHGVPHSRRPWWMLSAIAAGVFLCIGTLFGVWRWTQHAVPTPIVVVPKQDPMEVFEVAQANEITILRVEGADTESLVVGVPPLVGLLELADPGEVRVLNMQPDARDRMIPNVREQGRPMIWARIEADQ